MHTRVGRRISLRIGGPVLLCDRRVGLRIIRLAEIRSSIRLIDLRIRLAHVLGGRFVSFRTGAAFTVFPPGCLLLKRGVPGGLAERFGRA